MASGEAPENSQASATTTTTTRSRRRGVPRTKALPVQRGHDGAASTADLSPKRALRDITVPAELAPRKFARRRRYMSSNLNILTRRYVKIRGDLQVAINDPETSPQGEGYALRSASCLRSAKQELESHRPNLVVCASYLFLAESALIWLYPQNMLPPRVSAAREEVGTLANHPRHLIQEMEAAEDAENDPSSRRLRSALEGARTYLHQVAEESAISEELQVSRLRSLVIYLTAGLLMLLATVPFATNISGGIPGWPVVQFGSDELTHLVAAIAVGAVGAVGGIISGLIAVRDSTTSLLEYRTSMVKLALKPLVGAIAALTLYLLLSWQVLSGIEVTSGGSFLLVGFLAGFSERYFLRLLGSGMEEKATDKNPRIP